MVRYTGRQKTITGAVNRNQVGLKMSGCPSRVGRSGKNIRLLGRRVNCMYGLCGPTMVSGAPWRTSGRNFPPYCRQRSTACAQAAGGVGHINSPYTRTRVPAAGKQGCTPVNVVSNVVSPPVASPNLLLINTIGNPSPSWDTVIIGYKNKDAGAIMSDDVTSDAHKNKPQNYDAYEESLYMNNGGFEKNSRMTSLDIDLSTMYGGDTYRFFIMQLSEAWPDGLPPPYNQANSGPFLPGPPHYPNPVGTAINFGIAPKPTGNILNVNPLTLQYSFTLSDIVPGETMKYYIIDITLNQDKTACTWVEVVQ
jgi:hypothetical protein